MERFYKEIGSKNLNTTKCWCYCRCNVGYASTCNSVGQTAGFFLGYVLFMAFESPDFCNAYLRTEPSDKGMVTLAGNFPV